MDKNESFLLPEFVKPLLFEIYWKTWLRKEVWDILEMILKMIIIARGVLAGYEPFHLSRGCGRLKHKWVGVLIYHVFIHHLLWRRDSIGNLILGKANSDGGISHDALSHNLLRRFILVYAHLRVVRCSCHHLTIGLVLLNATWRRRLVEKSASTLILRCHWLCGRWHHHRIVIHLAREIVFSILLHIICAWNHPCVSEEGATIGLRGCVWQLLMMLMQEWLVCMQVLLLVAIQTAVCCSQWGTS